QGPMAISLERSLDGGVTWSQVNNFSDSTWCAGAGPVVGLNGELFVGYYDFRDDSIKVATSYDSGTTWGVDVKVCDAPFLGLVPQTVSETTSDPCLAIDRSGDPSSGRLYACFATNYGTGSGADIFLSSSDDGGATWSALTTVNDDGTWRSQFFPALDVDVNG